MSKGVHVYLVETEAGLAYDVAIADDEASVGQYIAALDAFLVANVAACHGCDLCCHQRIPLTLPDVYHYSGNLEINLFLEAKTVVSPIGGALDIRLRQGEDDRCIYLDAQDRRCLDYEHRGVVCHTYICIPQTPRARDLRETLINEGEDALIAHLLHGGFLPQYADWRADYAIKPTWEGKTYAEILIRDVVPPALWARLRIS